MSSAIPISGSFEFPILCLRSQRWHKTMLRILPGGLPTLLRRYWLTRSYGVWIIYTRVPGKPSISRGWFTFPSRAAFIRTYEASAAEHLAAIEEDMSDGKYFCCCRTASIALRKEIVPSSLKTNPSRPDELQREVNITTGETKAQIRCHPTRGSGGVVRQIETQSAKLSSSIPSSIQYVILLIRVPTKSFGCRIALPKMVRVVATGI